MSHTPGPWHFLNYEIWAMTPAKNELISHYVNSTENAFLIAAAPDLLKALKECAPALARFGYDSESVKKAYEAIAKAEGKEHEVQKK